MDVVALLSIDLGGFFKRDRLALGCLRERGDLAVAVEEELLGFGEALFDLGQAVGDGEFEDAAGVLVFFVDGSQACNVAFQRADAGIAAVDFDELAGGFEREFLEIAFEFVDADGVVGADAILVGGDLRFRQRHRALQFKGGEARSTAAIGRRDHAGQQPRNREAEHHQHGRLDGEHPVRPRSSQWPPPVRAIADGNLADAKPPF